MQVISSWITQVELANEQFPGSLVSRLAGRNSEETISIAPVYWAQRCKDALFSVETLKEVLRPQMIV